MSPHTHPHTAGISLNISPKPPTFTHNSSIDLHPVISSSFHLQRSPNHIQISLNFIVWAFLPPPESFTWCHHGTRIGCALIALKLAETRASPSPFWMHSTCSRLTKIFLIKKLCDANNQRKKEEKKFPSAMVEVEGKGIGYCAVAFCVLFHCSKGGKEMEPAKQHMK